MPNKKKLYIILFSTVVLICLFGFIWSFSVTKNIVKNEETGEKNQEISVKNLILTETKEGKIYWELYAKKGTYQSKMAEVILSDTTGNFYNEENEVVLSFRSDFGHYNENTKVITLKGNTLIVVNDGSSIKADEIVFKGVDEDITANGHVIVNRNNELISNSESARFNTDLTFFEIKGKTETKLYNKDEVTKTRELEIQ